jgi:hypothetical protein
VLLERGHRPHVVHALLDGLRRKQRHFFRRSFDGLQKKATAFFPAWLRRFTKKATAFFRRSYDGSKWRDQGPILRLLNLQLQRQRCSRPERFLHRRKKNYLKTR